MRGPPIGAWGREHSRAAPSGGTVPGVPRLAPAALVAMALFAGCSTTDDSTATSSTTQAEEAPSPPSALGTASLPLGDGKYTTAPAKGSVFSCQRFGGGGGAFRDGPWIDVAAGTWDPAAKLAVRGSIDRHGSLTGRTSGGGETLTGNGLPTVPTGTFPIAADDPAYRYDRNPNSVRLHARCRPARSRDGAGTVVRRGHHRGQRARGGDLQRLRRHGPGRRRSRGAGRL